MTDAEKIAEIEARHDGATVASEWQWAEKHALAAHEDRATLLAMVKRMREIITGKGY